MLGLLLLKKIASLFIILVIGAVIVKSGLLKSEDSKGLSVIVLYAINPCIVFSAFSVEKTDELMKGMGLALLSGLLMIVLAIVVVIIFRKALHLTSVEQASLEYTNAGNLIIPLITATIGPEWVVYNLGYTTVQKVFIWTHLDMMMSGQKKFNLKKILLNPNIIAIFVAFFFFFFSIKLPAVLVDSIEGLSTTLGPLSMLITGMVIGGADLKKIFSNRRIWMISFGRLIVLALLSLVVLKYSGLAFLAADGKMILYISLLSSASCSASTIVPMAQIYDQDAEYASAISVATTLLCMITLPVMTYLYMA